MSPRNYTCKDKSYLAAFRVDQCSSFIYLFIYLCMYVCMYVCIYSFIYSDEDELAVFSNHQHLQIINCIIHTWKYFMIK